jgi:aspartate kinase
MKFGGTSVADVNRIHHVAEIIATHRLQHPDLGVIAVVSAMAGETNRLVSLARSCASDPPPRELDVLLATGEQVTVALLAMCLAERGIPAKSLLAQQVRISTDSRHTNAHIEEIDTAALEAILMEGGVPVVAGFQGIDLAGDITTLGRGGSDITAVAIAAAINAQYCFIYTDVPGVFSTDPRVCSAARLLPRVFHEEMLEMASLGAKVLHTRSVYFAMRYGVPLAVLSTFGGPFEPGRNGTVVVADEGEGMGTHMEQPVVTGITHRLDEARIVIERLPSDIATMSRLFTQLGEKGVFIDMISQEGVEPGILNVSITVPDENTDLALESLREIVPVLHAQGVRIERDIAKVSVVGIGMRYHTGVAAKMFAALAREGIDVQMINTSEIKISVLVPRKYGEVAVRVLHAEFVEDIVHSNPA